MRYIRSIYRITLKYNFLFFSEGHFVNYHLRVRNVKPRGKIGMLVILRITKKPYTKYTSIWCIKPPRRHFHTLTYPTLYVGYQNCQERAKEFVLEAFAYHDQTWFLQNFRNLTILLADDIKKFNFEKMKNKVQNIAYKIIDFFTPIFDIFMVGILVLIIGIFAYGIIFLSWLKTRLKQQPKIRFIHIDF